MDLHPAETARLRLPTKTYTEKTTLESVAADDPVRLQINLTVQVIWIIPGSSCFNTWLHPTLGTSQLQSRFETQPHLFSLYFPFPPLLRYSSRTACSRCHWVRLLWAWREAERPRSPLLLGEATRGRRRSMLRRGGRGAKPSNPAGFGSCGPFRTPDNATSIEGIEATTTLRNPRDAWATDIKPVPANRPPPPW